MRDDMSQESPLSESEYRLETSLNCHHCQNKISSVWVVRLLRVKVSFVSTLPRRGHVLICPECKGILSADLGGMT